MPAKIKELQMLFFVLCLLILFLIQRDNTIIYKK